MIINKIQFFLKTKYNYIKDKLGGFDISLNYIIVTGFMLLVIFTLGLNIFNVYQRGKRNLDQIILEKQKLEELIEEGEELNEELEYRRSLQFVESYSRENLYLSRLGERLYRLDKDQDTDYEVRELESDPIVLEEHDDWWKRIFLW